MFIGKGKKNKVTLDEEFFGKYADLLDIKVYDEVTDVNQIQSKKRKAQNSEGGENKKSKLDVEEEEEEQDSFKDRRAQLKKREKRRRKKMNKRNRQNNGGIAIESNCTAADDDAEGGDVVGMSHWDGLHVPPQILRSLKEKNFMFPTLIQARVLPSAIRDRLDIIGAAETGSGKTLAFAIPIVAHLLRLGREEEGRDDEDEDNSGMDDEDEVVDNDEESDDGVVDDEDSDDEVVGDDEESDDEVKDDDDDKDDDEEGDDEVMGDENDEHQMMEVDDCHDNDSKHCAKKSVKRQHLRAVIMTPTRELALQIVDHIKVIIKYTNIKCVGLVGGMSEQRQSRLLKKRPEIIVATPGRLWKLIEQGEEHVREVKGLKFLAIDEVDRMTENNHFEEIYKILEFIHSKSTQKKQVFVFSATLTFVHKMPGRFNLTSKKKMKNLTAEDKLGDLREKLKMSSKPKVFDLTGGQNMVAQQLVEKKMECTVEYKDYYLHYFLKYHPGRTIIFANSKDCIRRLTSVLKVLNHNALPLHAGMPQRQRLKNMDRFKGNENALLIATDVAARGLDISDVLHVVHYQAPRTTENYVHRSGRTARSNKEGLSVVLVSPEEGVLFRQIMTSLKKKDLPCLEVDRSKFNDIKRTVELARFIEKEDHSARKANVDKSVAARADLDSEKVVRDDEDVMREHARVKRLKFYQKELNQLLGISSVQTSKKQSKKNTKVEKKFEKVEEKREDAEEEEEEMEVECVRGDAKRGKEMKKRRIVVKKVEKVVRKRGKIQKKQKKQKD